MVRSYVRGATRSDVIPKRYFRFIAVVKSTELALSCGLVIFNEYHVKLSYKWINSSHQVLNIPDAQLLLQVTVLQRSDEARISGICFLV